MPRFSLEACAEPLVGGNAAGHDERAAIGEPGHQLHRAGRLHCENVGHSFLEGRADIGAALRGQREFFCCAADGGLQAGKAHVQTWPVEKRPRKSYGACSAGQRCAFDGGPTLPGEAKKLGGLVEGFARRIVDRRAEAAIAPDALHEHELAMTA